MGETILKGEKKNTSYRPGAVLCLKFLLTFIVLHSITSSLHHQIYRFCGSLICKHHGLLTAGSSKAHRGLQAVYVLYFICKVCGPSVVFRYMASFVVKNKHQYIYIYVYIYMCACYGETGLYAQHAHIILVIIIDIIGKAYVIA